MSNRLISETYRRDLRTSMRKSVMALLADKASDDGTGIYCSKQTMADELCCSKRAIQQTISGLVDDGLLIVVGEHACDRGHTVDYKIDVDRLQELPLVACHVKKAASKEARKRGQKGEPDSPVNDVHGCTTSIPRGEGGAPKPSSEPFITPPTPRARGRREWAAIPDAWEAGGVDTLPKAIAALVCHWPDGAYQAEAAAFHQHWLACGRKQFNWDARWAARVQQRHGEVMKQAQQNGMFNRPAPGRNMPQSAPPPPCREKGGEDERSSALHAAIAEIIGTRLAEQWFSQCALLVSEDTITVIAPSTFVSEWIESNQRHAVSEAMRALGWPKKVMRHRVTEKASTKGAIAS